MNRPASPAKCTPSESVRMWESVKYQRALRRDGGLDEAGAISLADHYCHGIEGLGPEESFLALLALDQAGVRYEIKAAPMDGAVESLV